MDYSITKQQRHVPPPLLALHHQLSPSLARSLLDAVGEHLEVIIQHGAAVPVAAMH